MMKHLLALLCGALLFSALSVALCQDSQVQMTFGNTGVTGLNYAGAALLQDGALQVKSAQMVHWDGVTSEPASLAHGRRTVDLKTHTVTCTYPWGAASCQYSAGANRLDMVMTVSNTGKLPLSSIVLQPLALRFPAAVTLDGDKRKGNNVEAPTVVGMDYGSGVVVLANDEVPRPLYVGLAAGVDEKKVGTPFPILVGTAKTADFPNEWMADQVIDRTIYPGASDTFHISLRFGAAKTPVTALAGDIYQAFAAAYPLTVKWSDHRPIGMLALCSVEMTTAKNPRGWLTTGLMNPACKYDFKNLDVSTAEGREALHTNLLVYADFSIAELKRVGAQGMITWDIEGQQYPHATSYLGDPRSLPAEMDPIIDEYFKRFTDAGLRVGLTIRPTRPVRAVYTDGGVEQVNVADELYNLEQKIRYANQRWGCTIFYIDSNCKHDPARSWSDEAAYQLMSSTVIRATGAKIPGLPARPRAEGRALLCLQRTCP